MTQTELSAYRKLRTPFFYSHSKDGPIGRIEGRSCRFTTRCEQRERADMALRAARTIARFEELEYAGHVRLRVEFDDYVDVSWMDDKQREAWDGEAYGTISEYRDPFTLKWGHADSCWGHIGYRDPADPFENPCVIDEMAEAIGLYEDACLTLGVTA